MFEDKNYLKSATRFKILPELRLIVEVYQGTLTVEDFIRVKLSEAKNPCYSPEFNVIADMRASIIKPLKKEVGRYAESIQSQPELYGSRRSAILTDTPDHVVAATLYEFINAQTPLRLKAFSLLTACLDWIEVPYDKMDLVQSVLRELGES